MSFPVKCLERLKHLSVPESPFTLKHSDAPEGGLAEGTDSCISWLSIITWLTLKKRC